MAYFSAPSLEQWRGATYALHQAGNHVQRLREMIYEHHLHMGWGNPAEEMPGALEMLNSSLHEAQVHMASCAAVVHAITLDIGAQVHTIPTSSPVIEEIESTDVVNENDDKIAVPCELQGPTRPPDVPEEGVYCKECEHWYNGEKQYNDHLTGKKHIKNVNKHRRGNASSAVIITSVPDDTEVVAGFGLMKQSDMWLWLEKGKEEKEAEEQANDAAGSWENISRTSRRRRAKKLREAQNAALEAEGAAGVLEPDAKVDSTLSQPETFFV